MLWECICVTPCRVYVRLGAAMFPNQFFSVFSVLLWKSFSSLCLSKGFYPFKPFTVDDGWHWGLWEKMRRSVALYALELISVLVLHTFFWLTKQYCLFSTHTLEATIASRSSHKHSQCLSPCLQVSCLHPFICTSLDKWLKQLLELQKCVFHPGEVQCYKSKKTCGQKLLRF